MRGDSPRALFEKRVSALKTAWFPLLSQALVNGVDRGN